MSESGGTFDLVILGGGSGGYSAAIRASELGMRVALIEKDKLGGTCLHYGCIPTKALLHAGEVADTVRASEKFGVRASFDTIDMARVHSTRHKVVSGLHRGLTGLIKARGITLVEGEGKLTGVDEVTVNGVAYKGRHIILATGSQARSLPGLEIDGSGSSPATRRSAWTGSPSPRSSWAAVSSASSSPACGVRSAPR